MAGKGFEDFFKGGQGVGFGVEQGDDRLIKQQGV
jgi:hypothetical protein